MRTFSLNFSKQRHQKKKWYDVFCRSTKSLKRHSQRSNVSSSTFYSSLKQKTVGVVLSGNWHCERQCRCYTATSMECDRYWNPDITSYVYKTVQSFIVEPRARLVELLQHEWVSLDLLYNHTLHYTLVYTMVPTLVIMNLNTCILWFMWKNLYQTLIEASNI